MKQHVSHRLQRVNHLALLLTGLADQFKSPSYRKYSQLDISQLVQRPCY